MTSETLVCVTLEREREREKGDEEAEEAASIGSALEKPFSLLFFSLKGKNWDAKPVVSFVRCGQRHLGFFAVLFLAINNTILACFCLV